MTHEEGNKLIAEFMGLYQSESGDFGGGEHKAWYSKGGYKKYDGDPIPYHSSWDWLMPVVEKIKSTNVNIASRFEYDEAGTSIVICLLPPYQVEMWNETGWSYRQQGVVLIDEVWKATISFIQWFNQTKPLTNE